MAKGDEKESSGLVILWTAVVVVLVLSLPMLYVLGLGPAILLHQNGIAQGFIETVYTPLEWAVDYLGPLGTLIEWYAGLWH
jgi:ABC-type sugar transport system permease subunit